MYRLLVIFYILPSIVSAQKAKREQVTIVDNLKKHIGFLANDRLEGRRAGTEGERTASQYISEQFKRNGLLPVHQSGEYFQSFFIEEGKKVDEGASISVAGKGSLLYPIHFQPLSCSPSVSSLKVSFNPSINEKGNAWILNLSDFLEKNSHNPHFDMNSALNDEIVKMSRLGSVAVIVSYSEKTDVDHKFNAKDRSATLPIPAFFIRDSLLREFMNDSVSDQEIMINYRIVPSRRNSRNVVGWIDNKSSSNIVIGAHYDHLGYGEDGNSMLSTNERAIHNGADDNASGTAAMIELSRLIKTKNPGSHNYYFVAFSGEELGLYGSKFFVENAPYPIDKTSYMINLDMVGRLNDSSRTLTIGGYGTALQWPELLNSGKNEPGFIIRIDSSGTGPSDHATFYRKDIPVLFFFTGLHSDYHKPTDDLEKINYNGTKDIVRFIKSVVDKTASYARLDFRKTREQQTGSGSRFTVSMGIMPDYTYSGSGVRVDGVSEGRPAKSVGIMQGDIVVMLGNKEVDSVDSYMKALSGYKKGDRTKVVVRRGSETVEYYITF